MNRLLKRFHEIIHLNKDKEEVLALIGLGSMHDTSRLDDFSDIDFFIIVQDEKIKQHYMNHTS